MKFRFSIFVKMFINCFMLPVVRKSLFLFFFSLHLSFEFTLMGDENWTNWMGPNYNGSLLGQELMLPPEGKEYVVEWEASVGEGWASPVMDKSSVYLHHRVGKDEIIQCLDLKTGRERWQYSYPSEYRDDFGMANGPRSTPSLSEGLIVTHGPQGFVHALRITDGALAWRRDLKKDFSSPKGFFGRCSSPLIIDNLVIFDVGGPKTGLVALSLISGKTKWTTKPYGNDYSSPVPFFSGTEKKCLAFVREGFLAVSISSGRERFFAPFRSPINASVNASTPLVIDNLVFLSSCYEVGAGLWEYQEEGDSRGMFEKVWHKKEILDCHYSTPVFHAGNLYGFHGRQERGAVLRSVRLRDGKLNWEKKSLGSGNLIRIKNKICTLTEHGEFIVFSADPEKFSPLIRQQILGTGVRSHFAVSNGFLIARDQRRLVCLNLNLFE